MNCCELPKCNMLKGRTGWISQFSDAWECGNWKIISRVAYNGKIQNYLYSTSSCVSSHFPTFHPCPQLSLSSERRFAATRHYSVSPWGAQSGILFFPLESPCLLFQKYHFSARSHGYQQSWGFLSLGTRPMRTFWARTAFTWCFIKETDAWNSSQGGARDPC